MNGKAHINCANMRIFSRAKWNAGHSDGIYKYRRTEIPKKIEQYEWRENRKCILHLWTLLAKKDINGLYWAIQGSNATHILPLYSDAWIASSDCTCFSASEFIRCIWAESCNTKLKSAFASLT